MRCAVVVPAAVTAIGVSPRRPCSTSAAAALPIDAVAVDQHQRLVRAGSRRPVRLRRFGRDIDDMHCAGPLVGHRDTGVRRHRDRRADAGHQLEAELRLRAGVGLLGEPAQHRRVAGEDARRPACPSFAAATSALPAPPSAQVVSMISTSVAAVGQHASRCGRGQATTSAAASASVGAQGEQTRVAGAAADEGDGARLGLVRVVVT